MKFNRHMTSASSFNGSWNQVPLSKAKLQTNKAN